MHKDLQRRYRSAEALIRDIDHYLKGEPLEARPDSVRYRLGKFVRRNRRVLASAAAVCRHLHRPGGVLRGAPGQGAHGRSGGGHPHAAYRAFHAESVRWGDKTVGPAGSLRAVALLDRGVQNARTLNAEPAVQAELYQTLGNMYQKLGKYDQADALLRSSLERRKSIAGPDSPEVAEGLVALGALRLDQGQLAEAERLVQRGLAIDRAPFACSRSLHGEGRVRTGTDPGRARRLQRSCQDS